ncbi:hypothetical protein MASR1M60_30750 [Rhodocyclaceae bacterium]
MKTGGGDPVVLSPEDSVLDAFCLTHGGSLPSIDQHLAAIPEDNPNLAELRRYRRNFADALLNRRNTAEAEGWLYSLLVGLKSVILFIPKVASYKAEKSGAGKEGRKNAKAKSVSIIETVGPLFAIARAKLLAEGSKNPGAASIARIARQNAGINHPQHKYLTLHYAELWKKPINTPAQE